MSGLWSWLQDLLDSALGAVWSFVVWLPFDIVIIIGLVVAAIWLLHAGIRDRSSSKEAGGPILLLIASLWFTQWLISKDYLQQDSSIGRWFMVGVVVAFVVLGVVSYALLRNARRDD